LKGEGMEMTGAISNLTSSQEGVPGDEDMRENRETRKRGERKVV